MKDVILSNVTKKYGEKIVLNDISVKLKKGKTSCILGGSGAGKTTLINVIAGLTQYSGKVEKDEDISYVFQSARLIPTMTVEKNLEYVLLSVCDKEERQKKVGEMLNYLEIESIAKSFPSEISGGEAQRVAIGRALVYPSTLLLMDEPFGALDIGLKTRLIKKFNETLKKGKKTVIFVTHDVDEAILLGDNYYILEKGKIKDEFSYGSDAEERDLSSKISNEIRKKIYGNLL